MPILRAFNSKIEDLNWHYICITWENTEGSYQLYMDGQLADSGTGLKKSHVIPRGGTAVLGQDQDSVGGGFSTNDAFGPGQLAEVNMWSWVLSGSEIAAQYQDCNIPQGSVHAWSQFKDAINGAVQVVEPWTKQSVFQPPNSDTVFSIRYPVYEKKEQYTSIFWERLQKSQFGIDEIPHIYVEFKLFLGRLRSPNDLKYKKQYPDKNITNTVKNCFSALPSNKGPFSNTRPY